MSIECEETNLGLYLYIIYFSAPFGFFISLSLITLFDTLKSVMYAFNHKTPLKYNGLNQT